MKFNVEIYSTIDIDVETPRLIEDCIKAVLVRENVDFDCLIDVSITNNDEIRDINKNHRGKDVVTDVLSFPMVNYENGVLNDNLALCKDPETNEVHLGDMVISYEKVIEQALEFGHSNKREFAFLTVHSVLHLLGYDHETNEVDCKLMQSKEKEILEKIGILRI